MRSSIIFTSSMSPSLMSWLTGYTQAKNVSKKEVIEEALSLYRDNLRKKELAHGFKKAAKDQEIIKMTEEGWDDYFEQIKEIK